MEEIKKEDYKECLSYIEKYWKGITYRVKEDGGVRIGLPNAFVSPNNGIFASDQFYWDTYFTILGLIAARKVELAKGMVDNLLYCFERFGIIPMRNRFYELGISQIPFLVPMIEEVFEATHDKHWLKRAALIAEKELKNYWTNDELTELHPVYQGLSRYCDHYILSATAEHESGWDMTSRFKDRCLDFLPVDLNSCLYRYETGLSQIFMLLGDKERAFVYMHEAQQRKETMDKLMWNEERGCFFDYNYQQKEQHIFYSVACFYPLWAGLASPEQAQKMRASLAVLECENGIANTQKEDLLMPFRQHDYPNGWPQQQWIVVDGLLHYDFMEDAHRIAKKWLDMNKDLFEKTGTFWEKYDVANKGVGKSSDRYSTQGGFGWTNAIFIRLIFQCLGAQPENSLSAQKQRQSFYKGPQRPWTVVQRLLRHGLVRDARHIAKKLQNGEEEQS